MSTRNRIYTIVEGHGEANRPATAGLPAVLLLINKLLQALECHDLFPAQKTPPFRLSYSEFFRGKKFENAIRYHTKYPDCAGLLVLLDMDDGCAKEEAIKLAMKAAALGRLPFSVAIVCATREYEAWFLASLGSIIPGQTYNHEPEARRDAKGWLRKHFAYRQTRDQAIYTRKLDITLAHSRSRSFRRLYHAIEEIIAAAQAEQPVITPLMDSTQTRVY